MHVAGADPTQTLSTEKLSLLALESAIELDRLMEGKSTSVTSINAFFHLLDNVGDGGRVTAGARHLVNPKTLDALGHKLINGIPFCSEQ